MKRILAREHSQVIVDTEERVPRKKGPELTAAIEKEYLSGVQSPPEIARRIGCSPGYVKDTLKWLKAYWASRYDTENLRRYLTLEIEELVEEAKSRYKPEDGKRGPTKEGRLALEGYREMASLHGLHETPAVAQIGDALSAIVLNAQQRQLDE